MRRPDLRFLNAHLRRVGVTGSTVFERQLSTHCSLGGRPMGCPLCRSTATRLSDRLGRILAVDGPPDGRLLTTLNGRRDASHSVSVQRRALFGFGIKPPGLHIFGRSGLRYRSNCRQGGSTVSVAPAPHCGDGARSAALFRHDDGHREHRGS
jgi:hypothetical protein